MLNAQEHLEKAIKINPEFADAHYELALILKDKKDYENSKKHFLKTIKIQPEFSAAHFNYALLLKEMNDHKVSLEHFVMAIDLDQNFANAHYHYGLLLADMEEYEEAGEALGRLLMKFKYPQMALFGLTITPIVIFIGLKFLFT